MEAVGRDDLDVLGARPGQVRRRGDVSHVLPDAVGTCPAAALALVER
ncbi:hypothetical protein [Streptomyces sp. NPDC051211]